MKPSIRVGITKAKAQWDELVEAVESGREPEIIITRWRRPVAMILPLTKKSRRRLAR